MTVFFEDRDYRDYLKILRAQTERWEVEVWAYALMPNHVHLILEPSTSDALSHAVGETHRQYALRTNQLHGWTGHLWQERFRSCAMDDVHTLNTARYILRNPVRAGLVESAVEWPYSSALAHTGSRLDPLVAVSRLARWVDDWETFLTELEDGSSVELLRQHTQSGRRLVSATTSAGVPREEVWAFGRPQTK